MPSRFGVGWPTRELAMDEMLINLEGCLIKIDLRNPLLLSQLRSFLRWLRIGNRGSSASFGVFSGRIRSGG
jgi:hypothetical protein